MRAQQRIRVKSLEGILLCDPRSSLFCNVTTGDLGRVAAALGQCGVGLKKI